MAKEEFMEKDRRRFLQNVAGLSGAALLGTVPGGLSMRKVLMKEEDELSLLADALPDPHKSQIDHIVVVMMENRSFDHLFGWIPTADGEQAGLTYSDPNDVDHSTHALA